MSLKDLQIIEVEETQAEIEIAPTESEEKITFTDLFPKHPENYASTCQLTHEDQNIIPEDQPNNQLDDQESLPQNQQYVKKIEECVLEDENIPENWPEEQNQQFFMVVEECVPEDKNLPENQESLPRIQQYGIKIKESKIVAVEETQAEMETAQSESVEKITFSDAFPQDKHVVPEDQPKDQDSLPQSKQSIMKVQESLSEDEQHISKVQQLISEDRESLSQSKQLILKVKKSLPFPEEEQPISEVFKSLNEHKQYKSYDSEMRTENLSTVSRSKQEDSEFPTNVLNKRSHKNDSDNCPDCMKSFTSVPALRDHLMQHRDPKQFLCELCDRFLPKRLKKAHNKLHTKVGDKFKCMICDKSFMTNVSLSNHISNHKSAKFCCETCPQRFFLKKNLKVHIENVHTKVEDKFKCKICNKVLANEGSLANHIEIHEGFKYRCKYCLRRFCQKKNLIVHIEKMHSASSLNLIACFICGISFKDSNSLDLHLAEHF